MILFINRTKTRGKWSTTRYRPTTFNYTNVSFMSGIMIIICKKGKAEENVRPSNSSNKSSPPPPPLPPNSHTSKNDNATATTTTATTTAPDGQRLLISKSNANRRKMQLL